jgi:hypothetical protein
MAEKHPNVTSYLITLTLVAPDYHCPIYDNYLLAKGWGPGHSLAKHCSGLVNLRILELYGFGFQNSISFLHSFCYHANLPSLAHFSFDEVIIQDTDLALFITTHKKAIHDVKLDNVDLYSCCSESDEEITEDSSTVAEEAYRTPWSTVFKALLQIENHCGIKIDKPMHFGRDVDLLGVDAFYDWSISDYQHFWGTTVQLVPNIDAIDDPFMIEDIAPEEMHTSIRVQRDEDWKKGLQHLDRMYIYSVMDPDREETPPWIREDEDTIDDQILRLSDQIAAVGSLRAQNTLLQPNGASDVNAGYQATATASAAPDVLVPDNQANMRREQNTTNASMSERKGKGRAADKNSNASRSSKATGSASGTNSKGKSKAQVTRTVTPELGEPLDDTSNRYNLRRSRRGK